MLPMVCYSRRPQSGQINCYFKRTYHVLPTSGRQPVETPSVKEHNTSNRQQLGPVRAASHSSEISRKMSEASGLFVKSRLYPQWRLKVLAVSSASTLLTGVAGKSIHQCLRRLKEFIRGHLNTV